MLLELDHSEFWVSLWYLVCKQNCLSVNIVEKEKEWVICLALKQQQSVQVKLLPNSKGWEREIYKIPAYTDKYIQTYSVFDLVLHLNAVARHSCPNMVSSCYNLNTNFVALYIFFEL